jgi:hypothetical protein
VGVHLLVGRKARLTFHQPTSMKEIQADMLARFIMKQRKKDLQRGYVSF